MEEITVDGITYSRGDKHPGRECLGCAFSTRNEKGCCAPMLGEGCLGFIFVKKEEEMKDDK